jgi:hypothetical protein|tara:strand:+ start:141 stop:386 length:246 start_codon:yes stop_codon:yes gene_type:complete
MMRIDKNIPMPNPQINASDKYAWVDGAENGDSVLFATKTEAVAAVCGILARNKAKSRRHLPKVRCARRTLSTVEHRVWFFK